VNAADSPSARIGAYLDAMTTTMERDLAGIAARVGSRAKWYSVRFSSCAEGPMANGAMRAG
jgi:hypothetical protein